MIDETDEMVSEVSPIHHALHDHLADLGGPHHDEATDASAAPVQVALGTPEEGSPGGCQENDQDPNVDDDAARILVLLEHRGHDDDRGYRDRGGAKNRGNFIECFGAETWTIRALDEHDRQ